MKRDRLFTGLTLLGMGILFLLNNFNVFSFHWGNIAGLWPLFLIIGGVNMVFSHQNSNSATAIKILVSIVVFAIVIYRGTMPADNHFWSNRFNTNTFFNDDNKDDDDDDGKKGIYKLEG